VAPDASFQPVGHGHQQLVPCSVPEVVVHALELVDIEEKDGDPAPSLFSGRERVLDAILE
jgi:hypothetical protein